MAKRSVLKLREGEKKPRVFINEHLTKCNAETFYQARLLRKEHLINNTWTFNCRIYIRTNGDTPENQKVIPINSLTDLEQFRKK